jgi:hypothetical protein
MGKEQLLDNGEISKTEYNQIKSQAKATTKDSDAE